MKLAEARRPNELSLEATSTKPCAASFAIAVTLGDFSLGVRARVVQEDEVFVEPGPQLGRSPSIERAHRRREHDPFVDLGLELEFELRCSAPEACPLDDVHKVTHPLDDLAKRIEREVFAEIGQCRKHDADLEVPVGPLAQEKRLALTRGGVSHEVLDVRDAVEAIEPLKRGLDPNGQGTNAPQAALCGSVTEGRLEFPRVGMTPLAVNAPASRSLPVFNQRS